MQYLVCTTNHAWCGYTNLQHWQIRNRNFGNQTKKNVAPLCVMWYHILLILFILFFSFCGGFDGTGKLNNRPTKDYFFAMKPFGTSHFVSRNSNLFMNWHRVFITIQFYYLKKKPIRSPGLIYGQDFSGSLESTRRNDGGFLIIHPMKNLARTWPADEVMLVQKGISVIQIHFLGIKGDFRVFKKASKMSMWSAAKMWKMKMYLPHNQRFERGKKNTTLAI